MSQSQRSIAARLRAVWWNH